MQIRRLFTRAGNSPYADIAFRLAASEIRNPDGSVVFRLDGRRGPGRLVAGRRRRPRAEVFPQGRRAGALRPVAEDGVPAWLWRRVARRARRWPSCPRASATAARPAPSRCSTASPAPGPIGAGRAAISTARTTPAPSTTSCGTCWRARWPRPTRRNGSTPACTGPMASTARPRATTMSTTNRRGAGLDLGLRAPAAACLLHPVRRGRPRQRGRHHGSVGARGAPVQVRLGHRDQFLEPARRGERLSGGGTLVRADELPQDRRPRGRRHQVRRHDAARRQDGDRRHRPSRHRGVHRLEGASRSRRSRRWSPARKLLPAAPATPIMAACHALRWPATSASTRRQNPALEGEIRAARQAMLPENYDPAGDPVRQPGLQRDRGPDLRHRLGQRRLSHRVRPELEQLGARHRRVHASRGRGTATGS